ASRAAATAAANMRCTSSVSALSNVSLRLAPIRPVFSGVMMKSAPASRASRACSRTKAMFSSMSLLTLVWISPALKRFAMGPASARLGQQRVELAGRLEGRKLVRAANVLAVDEDLRDGGALGPRAHLAALLVVHHDVHLVVRDALVIEQ